MNISYKENILERFNISDKNLIGQGGESLVSNGFESIENTKEKFKPRYQIELSKSGEVPENPYLFDPNKPTRSPRRHAIKFRIRTHNARAIRMDLHIFINVAHVGKSLIANL